MRLLETITFSFVNGMVQHHIPLLVDTCCALCSSRRTVGLGPSVLDPPLLLTRFVAYKYRSYFLVCFVFYEDGGKYVPPSLNNFPRKIYLNHATMLFFPMAQEHPVGQGFLIIEATRSHSDTRHSVGLLWMGHQPDAEISTWQHTTLPRDRSPCSRRNSNP
jgi:hypothetical protein